VFVGSPAFGTHTKYGQNVTVDIKISLTNVSNFGTGQYSVTLPFLPLSSSNFVFNGILQTSSSIHKIVGYNTAGGSATLNLYYLGTNGIGTNLTGTAPVTLTSADVITLNGSYISIS
jgi:hypothetical protein